MDPALSQSAAFMADPTPKAVVDRDYVVRAVNPAYCRATERDHDELISQGLFDLFPDNPDDPDAHGVENAIASFERVLRTGRPDNMLIQRHDIADPDRPGEFMRRDWMPVHSPLLSGDDVAGILVQISDVTPLRADVAAAMEYYRAVLAATEPTSGESDASQASEHHQRMVDTFTEGIRHFNDLADEVTQLREALTTRATIEQAKGMLMISRRCSPEDAFEMLRRASRHNNVRLGEVAAMLIQQHTAKSS